MASIKFATKRGKQIIRAFIFFIPPEFLPTHLYGGILCFDYIAIKFRADFYYTYLWSIPNKNATAQNNL